MRLSSLFDRNAYVRWCLKALARLEPNLRGVTRAYPGNYESPLIDLAQYATAGKSQDGAEMWEAVDLRPSQQRAFYEAALAKPLPAHVAGRVERCRYKPGNQWFCQADAFTQAAVLSTVRPRRVIEIGSGHSSAAMLDTLEAEGLTTAVTFIEPYAERLRSVLRSEDVAATVIIERGAQDMPIETFDVLERDDILFIDSSHVAKIGSDVAFLFLRVLPRLKPGVVVHVHDIFYPYSYLPEWIGQGLAWNESLFLRALLVGNRMFEVLAFSHYAADRWPDLFAEKFPAFMTPTGGSIWLRKL